MNRALVLAGLACAAIFLVILFVLRGMPVSPDTPFETTVYFLVSFVVFLDLIDVLIRLRRARAHGAGKTSIPLRVGTFTPHQIKLHLRPYALIASVHNLEDHLDAFLEAMEPYRDRLWVIDDASTDRTFVRIRQAGFHCIRGEVNRKKPGALKELLKVLPANVETVGILDPDVSIMNRSRGEISDLERSIFEFQRTGYAAMCPRIVVRQDGWLARLQELEYAITFAIGKRSLADRNITSGAAFYRRDALEQVFSRHRLSVYAEDLRNALLLLGHGEKIYYDDRLVLETEGKRTLRSWFSQRVAWFFGLMKVYGENFEDVRRTAGERVFFAYHFLLYMGVFAILFHPLKVLALLLSASGVLNAMDELLGLQVVPNTVWTDPIYFLVAYVKYTILAVFLLAISAPGERRRLAEAIPLFYLYQLMHIVPITIGYLNWLALRFLGRRVYRDHFQDEASLANEFREQYGRTVA